MVRTGLWLTHLSATYSKYDLPASYDKYAPVPDDKKKHAARDEEAVEKREPAEYKNCEHPKILINLFENKSTDENRRHLPELPQARPQARTAADQIRELQGLPLQLRELQVVHPRR